MSYTDEMNEVNECLEGWEEKGYDGIVAAHAILEYSQWIEKIDFNQAKELMYRFNEKMLHPEWD